MSYHYYNDYRYDDEPNGDSDPVYWKILVGKDRKITIACLQSFDEYDYDQKRFLLGEDKQPMKFSSEEDAILYLNENFKPEFIDDEYLTPNNQEFFRSARR